MKQSKKSLGMKISAFVLSFAMVCTLLAGVNVVAFAADEDEVESTPVFCAYNQNNGEHFFTTDEAEYNHLVELTWGAEGEKWQAPVKSKSPIFRLYNQNSGEHYFTLDANEAKSLASIGWNDEGIGLYSDDEKATPVYCMYNPNATGQFEAGAHHYTKDAAEAAHLESIGWVWTNDGQAAFYGVKEEEPQILVKVTDADQLTANQIEVTFDQVATGLVDKDDIVVAKADGTLVLPVLNMELGADGTTATLTLSTNMVDETEYEVSLNESSVAFTASLGKPAYVTVSTDKAQKGVVTPIEFALYDSKGVDVTSTVNVDGGSVTVEVEGDANSDTSTPSKATLTMDEVGATADIIVTYNDGEGEMEDIVGKNTVTCIPAEAVVGYPVYTTLEDKDKAMFESPINGMAKFYLGKIQSDPVTVVVGEASDTVYFSAVNLADMSVYAYDEYEISSSDEDIMSISDSNAGSNEGKECKFKVTGNAAGTANIVVTAKANDTETPYTIPVKVVPKGTLSSVTYTVDRTRMTNADDVDYYALSDAYAVDTNGMVMDGNKGTDKATFDYKITSGKKAGDENETDGDAIAPDFNDPITGNLATAGFTWNEVDDINDANGEVVVDKKDGHNYQKYTAYASAGGKKVIQVTASVGEKAKTKSITINVDKLGKAIWNTTNGDEQKVDYAVELSRNSVLSNPDNLLVDSKGVQARLAASVGGKFVGYVRTDAQGHTYIGSLQADQRVASGDYQVATCSAIKVNKASAIKTGSLAYGVKFGSKYSGGIAPVGCQTQFLAGNTRESIFNVSLGDKDAVAGTLLGSGKVGAINAQHQQAHAGAFEGVNEVFVVNATKAAQFNTDNDTEMDYVADASLAKDFTPSGTYTVTYAYITGDGKDSVVTKPAALTVGNVLGTLCGAEVIDVTSRTVDSLSKDGVKEVIVARADMNNSDSDASVVEDFAIVDNGAIAILGSQGHDWGSDSQYVKYAVVKERVAVNTNNAGAITSTLKINFYVPLNKTFKTK